MEAEPYDLLAPASCGCDARCGGLWFGGGEYLYIRTHFSEAIGFATLNLTPTPQGLLLECHGNELDFDYTSSFRAFVGRQLHDGSALRFTYWNLDTSTTVRGEAGAGQFIVDPFGNFGVTGFGVNAGASVQMNVFDLEYLRPIHMPCAGLNLTYSAGVRIADVDQYYDSIISDPAANATSIGIWTAGFTGAGPYLSLTGESQCGGGRQLSLLAKLGAGLLVGQYDVGSRVTIPGMVIATQTADRTRMIPVLEAELGAAWKPGDRATLSAGWLFQAWWNLGASGGTFDGENLPLPPGLELDTVFGGADDSDTMSFDGLFVRAEVLF